MEETPNCVIKCNKRYFGAIGSILLPLAPKWRLFSLMVGGALAALIMPSLIPIVVSAASITLSVSPTLSVNVTPTVIGAFATSSNGTISVESDAPFGYELGIKSGGSNALTSGTNTIPSITENVDESIFKSDPKYNNTWGFKPSKWNGSNNDKYLPGPTATEPTVIDTTNTKPTGVSSYTITLGAKIDVTQPAGVYAQQFIVTATANAVNYAITYNDNGGSGGPGKVTGESIDQTITLSSKMPTREGYEFKGWCDKQTTNETCSGTAYQPNSTYKLQNSANNATMWAMWESAQPTTMQNFGSYCSSMTEGQTIKLTDSRDNNSYTVAKLKDGKCWMIDNLKLGSGLSAGRTKVLTSNDSDVPASGFTMTMTAEKAKYTGSGATRYDMDAAYIDPEYGGYYSWHTATAGTGTYAMSTSGQNATNSICPKGWRLPTGGSSSDFADLVNAYGGNNSTGSSNLRATPVPNFQYSGLVWNNGDGLDDQGSYGYYWSSTVGSANNACRLYLNSFSANPAGNYNKYGGLSVRCVSRQ